MRYLFFVLTIILLQAFHMPVLAQNLQAVAEQEIAYLLVQVQPETSWDMLAAQWGILPAALRKANQVSDKDSVASLRMVKVPLEGILKTEPCDSCLPVFHTVKPQEGLYRIGKWYGNQTADNLKKANNLRSNLLQPGMALKVGYVRYYSNGMPVSTGSSQAPHTDTITVTEAPVLPPPPPARALEYKGNGFFEKEWLEKNTAPKQGKVAAFKSETGWSDGKFYVLIDQITPGTIVRIQSPQTGKFIFARVLGPLPEIRQNEGLLLRLNAAGLVCLGHAESETLQADVW